jgi:hypothetical protein
MKHRLRLITVTLCLLLAGGVEMILAASGTGEVSTAAIVLHAESPGLGLTSTHSTRLTDVSRWVGGTSGQFNGFDLDAIRLFTSSAGPAPSAGAFAELSVFDLSPAGTLFTPGTQCAPLDPALFGSWDSNINNSVGTRDVFHWNATTEPIGNGFIGQSNAGIVSFHHISTDTTTGLFHYMGEDGNEEVPTRRLIVLGQPSFSRPATLLLLVSVVGGLAVWRRTKKN